MEVVIAIVVVFIGIVIFFVINSKSRNKALKEREERLARASRGRAKIISSSPAGLSGTGLGGNYQAFKLSIEVSDGFQAPYRTEVIWEVYPMGTSKVQNGMELDVKIDRQDKTIVYPDADGLAISWNGLMIQMAKKI